MSGSGLIHDLDALEVMIDRLAAHRLIDMGEAAELLDVVLECIGVNRAERHTKISGIVPERAIVLDLVPRNVQRHFRCKPGQLVDLGSVGEFFLNGPRRAWRAEDLEPGAGVAESPRRQLNGLIGQLVGDVRKGWHVHSLPQESYGVRWLLGTSIRGAAEAWESRRAQAAANDASGRIETF